MAFTKKRSTISSPLLSAFLYIALFANETTNETMKQTIFNAVRFHEHNLLNKMRRMRGRNERRQQRLVRSVDEFITTTALASIVGSVTTLNVIKAIRVLQKHTNQSATLADDLESAIGSHYNEFIPPVEQLQKSQRRALSIGATQSSVKLIPTTPQKATSGCRNKSIALSSR